MIDRFDEIEPALKASRNAADQLASACRDLWEAGVPESILMDIMISHIALAMSPHFGSTQASRMLRDSADILDITKKLALRPSLDSEPAGRA
jgi:hypothetical protein